MQYTIFFKKNFQKYINYFLDIDGEYIKNYLKGQRYWLGWQIRDLSPLIVPKMGKKRLKTVVNGRLSVSGSNKRQKESASRFCLPCMTGKQGTICKRPESA